MSVKHYLVPAAAIVAELSSDIADQPDRHPDGTYVYELATSGYWHRVGDSGGWDLLNKDKLPVAIRKWVENSKPTNNPAYVGMQTLAITVKSHRGARSENTYELRIRVQARTDTFV